MRLKRQIIQEDRVKLNADPIFLHFAIASLVLAIIGAAGAILSDGFSKMLDKWLAFRILEIDTVSMYL